MGDIIIITVLLLQADTIQVRDIIIIIKALQVLGTMGIILSIESRGVIQVMDTVVEVEVRRVLGIPWSCETETMTQYKILSFRGVLLKGGIYERTNTQERLRVAVYKKECIV